MKLFLRAFLIAIPRHLLILAAIVALQQFDFSPLPDWTMIPVLYFIHFALTYLFAEWAMARGPAPGWKQGLITFATFLVTGTLMEFLVVAYLGGGGWADAWAGLSWSSLYLVLIYAAAVALATYRLRRKKIQAALPEGMES